MVVTLLVLCWLLQGKQYSPLQQKLVLDQSMAHAEGTQACPSLE
jgi:hypothetical protein